MIAAIVPAHNEARLLGHCLQSLHRAARCAKLGGEAVLQVVVLDACTDASAAVAQQWGAGTVTVALRNVGAARAAGADHALRAGARWLAFTDADSVVAPDWLSMQLSLGCEAVCGTVSVHDWGDFGPDGARTMREHFAATYTDADGHRHIHGANLGVSAAAYRRVGGFLPLASSEDVALVEALHRHSVSIAWSAAPRVVTSARRDFRAPDGFGATLQRVAGDARAARSAGDT